MYTFDKERLFFKLHDLEDDFHQEEIIEVFEEAFNVKCIARDTDADSLVEWLVKEFKGPFLKCRLIASLEHYLNTSIKKND